MPQGLRSENRTGVQSNWQRRMKVIEYELSVKFSAKHGETLSIDEVMSVMTFQPFSILNKE